MHQVFGFLNITLCHYIGEGLYFENDYESYFSRLISIRFLNYTFKNCSHLSKMEDVETFIVR